MAAHPLLTKKDFGFSKALRGHVMCNVVFVDDLQRHWSAPEKQEFMKKMREAMSILENEAATEKTCLRFTFRECAYFCDTDLANSKNATSFPHGMDRFYAEHEGFPSPEAFFTARKQSWEADELALIFVGKHFFRAHAIWHLLGNEYCCLYDSCSVHTIMHELLHLFGAQDLYYPAEIKDIAEFCFPSALMGSAGTYIDSLTKFLIGWRDYLSADAQFFLEQTYGITAKHLRAANALNIDKEETLQSARPYTSFEEMEKSATKGDPWAQFLLAFCCHYGIIVPQNLQLAVQHYQSSYIADIVISGYGLADILFSKEPLSAEEKARAKIILNNMAVANKHLLATSLCAVSMYTGHIFEKDHRGAFSIALRNYKGCSYPLESIEIRRQCDAITHYRIAEKYAQKIQPLHKALMKMTAQVVSVYQNGDPCMQYLMGRFWEDGIYINKVPRRAKELYQLAAEAGLSVACSALARCYSCGIGTQVDLAEAEKWKRKALAAKKREEESNTRFAVRLLSKSL